jgi:hypothetical protein
MEVGRYVGDAGPNGNRFCHFKPGVHRTLSFPPVAGRAEISF